MELRSGRRLRSSGTAPIGFASAMELRSGRRICSTQQVRSPKDLGPDRISALPDDLLLLILARLRSIVTAARTGILSRRWRNLWTLLSTLIFHNVKYSSLEPVLARLVSPAVSLLEIHIPITRRHPDRWELQHMSPVEVYLDAGVTSLLRAAARLEPEELVFAIDSKVKGSHVDVPYFRRATSIVLKSNTFSAPFHMPPGVEFVALDTLSLSCSITGLDDLISQCPRLRVLRLKVPTKNFSVMVHSTSLQELFVNARDGTSRVDIDAPVLRRLSMSLCPYRQLDISVMAPMMETISWYCSYCYVRLAPGFGSWRLNELRIQMAQRQEELPSLHIDASMCSLSDPPQVADFRKEIEKHLFAAFSSLELHLITLGHDYGSLVFHLIGMHQIRRAMRRLNVIIPEINVKKECPTNCLCCPTKVQTILLIALEEIQIDGFEGNGHEFDFLELVFKSAPMLKRVTVKLSHDDHQEPKYARLYGLFRAYTSVECCVYLSTGEYMACIHD